MVFPEALHSPNRRCIIPSGLTLVDLIDAIRSRMATSPSLIRRLTLSALLLLTLLFTQQGALLHELSHWHLPSKPAVEAKAEAASVDTDFCLDCLAFAQVAGVAHFDLPALPSQEGLSYHFASEAADSVAEASTPAPRSRGPPLFA